MANSSDIKNSKTKTIWYTILTNQVSSVVIAVLLALAFTWIIIDK